MISAGASVIYTTTGGPHDITAVGGRIRLVGGNYPDLSSVAAFGKVMLTPSPRDAERTQQLRQQYLRGQGFVPCDEAPWARECR